MSGVLRVAFPYKESAKFYEPTRIHLAPEYIFLENTFSPLVELSPEDGSIRKGIAEKWEWKGDELHLSIRNDLKTVDGFQITADDAAFSLKRLLVRTQNTHGNLKDLVCGATQVKSMSDKCEGIKLNGNTLILKIADKSAFILPMLSGIDFAIIPKRSVDPISLDIVDYRNTSGPYYVSRDSDTGEIELSVNRTHYHASNDIPQTIQLVPTDPKDKTASLSLFKKGQVDLITTIDAARPEQVFQLSKEIRGSALHVTANIRTFALFFTERGLAELSVDDRIALGGRVKGALAKHFLKLPGYENTDQFFPAHGDGSIDSATAAAFASRKASDTAIENKNLVMSIVRVGELDTFKSALQMDLPSMEVIEGKTSPAFEKYASIDKMPHAYIGGPDTGFSEDISLISYSLTAGFFGLTRQGRQEWLARYMSESEKENRVKMLQAIHESSLRDALFVPLFSSPYTALAQESWSVNLSKILANCQLWLVKKN